MFTVRIVNGRRFPILKTCDTESFLLQIFMCVHIIVQALEYANACQIYLILGTSFEINFYIHILYINVLHLIWCLGCLLQVVFISVKATILVMEWICSTKYELLLHVCKSVIATLLKCIHIVVQYEFYIWPQKILKWTASIHNPVRLTGISQNGTL